MAANSSLDEVFRFFVVRPPIAVPDEETVDLTVDSDLQNRIRRALNEDDGKLRAARLAEEYVAGGHLVNSVGELRNGAALTALAEALAGNDPIEDNDALTAAIEAAFDRPLDALAQEDTILQDVAAVADSLTAIKYAPGSFPQAEGLVAAARALDTIRRLARGNDFDATKHIAGALGLIGKSTAWVAPEITGRDVPDEVPRRIHSVAERIPKAIEEIMAAERRGAITAPEIKIERRQPAAPQPDGLLQKTMRFLGFTPQPAADIANVEFVDEPGVRLSGAAFERLSDDTREVLETLHLDPAEQPVQTVTMAMHQSMMATQPVEYEIMQPPGGWLGPDGWIPWLPSGDPSVPSSRGQVRPAGIGDLMVVRQQIKRYQGGEVGHIENVLRGESKEREHRRLERREQTFLFETETMTEEEREHEQTERFELQREVSKTIETEANLQAGVTVSGSYGPSVEFSTSFEVSAGTSTTETSRVASNYAKDVTDKSLSRLTERIKEQRTEKIINEVEERNLHNLSNEGDDHISGVYQWVDKVYEAHVFNYGKRLLFDITLPEPGAFVLHTMVASTEVPDLPVPPLSFTIRPHELTEANYGTYVARYGAVGVNPPPSPYTSIAKTFDERSGEGKDARLTKAAEVTIPEGYQATSASALWKGGVYDDHWFECFVGDRQFGGGWTSLGNLRGTIPVGMMSGRVRAFTLTIQVNCQRTQGLLDRWKLDTYDAIRQAYLERVRDYEDKLAAIEAEEFGVEIAGRNPLENRQIERTELRKASLQLLTEQRFELFNAMNDALLGGYPEFDFAEARAEGSYIRFFEHAFEWAQMTYVFYPYFWGRKEHWIGRFVSQDVDPQFAEFLKAGASRVIIPVRPGFEKAILHYLETGQIWNGLDEPPDVTSPMYVSLVQEIKERTGSFDNEVAVGDPWDVIVPTSLVKLRQDDALPEWAKQADGSWQPVP